MPDRNEIIKTNIIELEQAAPHARFRFGKGRFRRDTIAAASMTAILCILAFMIFVVLGSLHPVFYAAICAMSFFLFISANSIYRFLTRQVILSVTPAGLHDQRISKDVIPWENIRDLAFSPRENETVLKIAVWNGKTLEPSTRLQSWSRVAGGTEYLLLDLAELDQDAEAILTSVSRYREIRFDHDSQKKAGH